jgi:hypothetical protein
MASRGWDGIVIKPVVSAGSYRCARFDRTTAPAAQAFLDALTRDRDAMVQRWMPTVETHGERSLVWIDGVVTHAVRKSPRWQGGVENVSSAIEVADDERRFAETVLAPFAKDILYARVDMLRDERGVLRLMELELVEPSLFLVEAPAAADRFVKAIVKRMA